MEISSPSRHYLLFWQLRSVYDHAESGALLDVVASSQLSGVEPGDVLWIATLSEDRQMLVCGRMTVGEICGYEEAKARTNDPELWQAEYYAFSEPGTEQPLYLIQFEGLAEALRFADPLNDRIEVEDRKIETRQMRTRKRRSAIFVLPHKKHRKTPRPITISVLVFTKAD